MLKPPADVNTLFDTTVMPKLADPEQHRSVGILHEITLCRAGSLTCPVLTGIVYVGHIDYEQLVGEERGGGAGGAAGGGSGCRVCGWRLFGECGRCGGGGDTGGVASRCSPGD